MGNETLEEIRRLLRAYDASALGSRDALDAAAPEALAWLTAEVEKEQYFHGRTQVEFERAAKRVVEVEGANLEARDALEAVVKRNVELLTRCERLEGERLEQEERAVANQGTCYRLNEENEALRARCERMEGLAQKMVDTVTSNGADVTVDMGALHALLADAKAGLEVKP